MLEKLTLVTVCPNTVRDSTEQIGHILAAHEEQIIATAPTANVSAIRSGCEPWGGERGDWGNE